jgi:hypothetical protein
MAALRDEIARLQSIIKMKDQDVDILRKESDRKSTVDAEKQ